MRGAKVLTAFHLKEGQKPGLETQIHQLFLWGVELPDAALFTAIYSHAKY